LTDFQNPASSLAADDQAKASLPPACRHRRTIEVKHL